MTNKHAFIPIYNQSRSRVKAATSELLKRVFDNPNLLKLDYKDRQQLINQFAAEILLINDEIMLSHNEAINKLVKLTQQALNQGGLID